MQRLRNGLLRHGWLEAQTREDLADLLAAWQDAKALPSQSLHMLRYDVVVVQKE